MKLMQVQMTEAMINNLLIFLNRIEYKGLDEAQAVTYIVNAISQALTQNQSQNKNILTEKEDK